MPFAFAAGDLTLRDSSDCFVWNPYKEDEHGPVLTISSSKNQEEQATQFYDQEFVERCEFWNEIFANYKLEDRQDLELFRLAFRIRYK